MKCMFSIIEWTFYLQFFSYSFFLATELTKVQKNVAKRKHNLWYEARLLNQNGEKLDKPKKVYLYISPKVSKF